MKYTPAKRKIDNAIKRSSVAIDRLWPVPNGTASLLDVAISGIYESYYWHATDVPCFWC